MKTGDIVGWIVPKPPEAVCKALYELLLLDVDVVVPTNGDVL